MFITKLINKEVIKDLKKRANKLEIEIEENRKWRKKYGEKFEILEGFLKLYGSDVKDIVFCKKCGVAIKKDKAKVVIKEKQLIHYCDRHAPDYDRIEYNLLVGGSNKYYKDNVKVDVKGRIIKNKK